MPVTGTDPRPVQALRIKVNHPALATPEDRERAWADFLQWADLQLQDPEGPNWDDVQALISQVLPAVRQELNDAQWLQLQLRARMRNPDPKALRKWLYQTLPMPLIDSPALRDLIRLCRDAKMDRPEWGKLLKALRRRPSFARLPANAALLPLLGQALRTYPSPRSQQGTTEPKPEPEPKHDPDSLARWLKLENRQGSVRYWVAHGTQAPQTDDDKVQAQEAVLRWVLRELAASDGLRWPELVDIIDGIESAWPFRLDRQRLLGLCAWAAEQANNPGLLLQFLPLLKDCKPAECPLDGLIEQALNDQWAPPIRAALLQAIAPRLPPLDGAGGPLHARFLEAIFALPDPGSCATLLKHYLTTAPVDSFSETARLLNTVLAHDATATAPPNGWLESLERIQRREGSAPWPVWRVLSRALLERVASHLFECQQSADATQAKAANDLIRHLLFRLAHPEKGDRAQAIEDQFELLGALVHALDSERREAFLAQLDAAYATQIDNGLQALLKDTTRTVPTTALAMRGAIQALRAALPRQAPITPLPRKDNSTTGKAVRFFADWFAALRQPDANLQGIKLFHQKALFQVLMDPLTRDLTALMDGLFTLHDLSK